MDTLTTRTLVLGFICIRVHKPLISGHLTNNETLTHVHVIYVHTFTLLKSGHKDAILRRLE